VTVTKLLKIAVSFVAHFLINIIAIVLIFASAYVWANNFDVPFPPTKMIAGFSPEATAAQVESVAISSFDSMWEVWLGFSISALFCALRDNLSVGKYLYWMILGLPLFLYLVAPTTLSSGTSTNGFMVWAFLAVSYPLMQFIRAASCLFFLITIIVLLSKNFVGAFLLVLYVIVIVSLPSLLMASTPSMSQAVGGILGLNSDSNDKRSRVDKMLDPPSNRPW